ncbi:hypothetical protein I0C86_38250 [Plantactinospora sp. S1510]|uniref:Halobacterial output domain-containing protein n=1 Tax=Plantactinospora alkalitolerans TaxID=2789879 RepID=A0ABS0H8C9_9ACTN|nr:hypothetical protein [Plantactinospora alkalitolerans]MBF9134732.1 hypothetical protein [Plantactinospora alkalitolerans]
MSTDEDTDQEELLQRLLQHFLSSDDLNELCADAGLPVLIDSNGQPVYVREAVSYDDAGVMTLNRGVVIRLSDGGELQLTIVTSRHPVSPVQIRPPGTRA